MWIRVTRNSVRELMLEYWIMFMFRGVKHLHTLKVVHRDLKSPNLLLFNKVSQFMLINHPLFTCLPCLPNPLYTLSLPLSPWLFPSSTLLEGCTGIWYFRRFQRKLMYFSFHFHIKPHPLMNQYFAFDILSSPQVLFPSQIFPFSSVLQNYCIFLVY